MSTAQRIALGLLAVSALAVIVIFLGIRADHQEAMGASAQAARRLFWIFWGGPIAIVGSTVWLLKRSIGYELEDLVLWGTGAVHVLGWGLLFGVDAILRNA